MDKTIFEVRAISIFHNRKYVFYDELQQGGALKKMTDSQYAGLLAVGALVGFGAFMINRSSVIDIDLAAKSVWAYRGLPVNWVKPTDIETKLFS